MLVALATVSVAISSPVRQLLGNRWNCASDKEKIDWLLTGISTADFQINVRLFQLV